MTNSYLSDFFEDELAALIDDWKIDRIHELSDSIDLEEQDELASQDTHN